jgi:hypothetical protein
MLNKSINNFQKKSLKERFLFVIGLLIFIAYFIFGLIFIFWDYLPIAKSLVLEIESVYRISFGVLLIVYSFIRFFRIFNLNDE